MSTFEILQAKTNYIQSQRLICLKGIIKKLKEAVMQDTGKKKY